jgi:hypothetical protein
MLSFYPAGFRAEFGEEMESVFQQAISATNGLGGLVRLCARELRDLPAMALNEWLERIRGGVMNTREERLQPSSYTEAFLGVLPFIVCGVISILYEAKLPGIHIHIYLWFYVLVLVGFGVGWVKGFPLWSYGYLGWSLVFAYFWAQSDTPMVRIFGHVITRGENWGWRIWIPLGLTALIALLWTRSLEPLKRFFAEAWRDWTRLSLGMYALVGFMLVAIYDDNHHPYLLVFMAASTLLSGAGAWAFLRSTTVLGRVLSLAGSMIAGMVLHPYLQVIFAISMLVYSAGAWVTLRSTTVIRRVLILVVGVIAGMFLLSFSSAIWGWPPYFGLIKSIEPWQKSLWINTRISGFWLGILLWPAVVGGMRAVVRRVGLVGSKL